MTIAAPATATLGGLTAQLAFQRGIDESADIWVTSADGTWSKKLTGTGRDVDPAWSPDGNHIVFTGVREGNSDIFVMKHNGSDLSRLTTGREIDADPTWSPDGANIVFVSDGDLHSIASDGTGRALLVEDPTGTGFAEPAFSPDGSWIATGGENIHVMRADGTDRRRLTEQPYFEEASPDWSPDGTRIVFASQRSAAVDNTLDFDIWTMDADGSDAVRVGGMDGVNERHPVWSPDGTRISYWGSPDSPDTLTMPLPRW